MVCAGRVFASGQIPLDPKTGDPSSGEIGLQTRRAIENLSAVLEAADSSLERVVQTTVYLTDLSLFARMNAVYAEFFGARPSPARASVEVAALPLGASIEIAAIAAVGRRGR